MRSKTGIIVKGDGNIIIQGINNSDININTSDGRDILSKLNKLDNIHLDVLSQVADKENLGELFDTLLSGLVSQKNIVKGSISNIKGDVIIGDNHTRNYYFGNQEKSKKSKELTLNIPALREDQIIGRKKELEDIHNRLFNNKQVVLVNGMGGIGKTTLAQVYLTKYYSEYKYIAWVGVNSKENDFEADFISAEGLLSRFNIKNEGKTVRDLFIEIIGQLKELHEGPSLLIIDNAGRELGKYYNYLPKQPNWHLLVTSREQISYFDLKELDFLSEEEAVNLFRLHYHHSKLQNDFLVDLVKKLEYHTLTIEILAKTAQINRTSPDLLLNAIQNDLAVDVDELRHQGVKVKKLTSYLCSIFRTSKLEESEKYLLQQFICLPVEFLSYELLKELIEGEKISKSKLSKALNSLASKGWLLYNKDADSYKIHRIIIDVVKVSIGLEEKDVKLLIEKVFSKLSIDQTKDNPIHKFKWIPFGKAILIRFEKSTSQETSKLQNNLALVLQDLGDYHGAKELLEKAMSSDEKNFGADHPTTAVSYSNLALVLKDLGDYHGAKELLEKAMSSAEKNFGADHPTTAVSYSNLALVLQDLGDYHGAKELLEKAMSSAEKNFGADHPTTAVRYSNLALVLQALGDYHGAKELLEKAYKVFKNQLGDGHPNTKVIKGNLNFVISLIKK